MFTRRLGGEPAQREPDRLPFEQVGPRMELSYPSPRTTHPAATASEEGRVLVMGEHSGVRSEPGLRWR